MTQKLEDLELIAWVGEDDSDANTGVLGIKVGIVPAGAVPLAAISQHEDRLTAPYLVGQMQHLANQTGKRRFLARFKFDRVEMVVDPPDASGQVEIPPPSQR